MPFSRLEHMTCTSLMINTTRPLDSGSLDTMKYVPSQNGAVQDGCFYLFKSILFCLTLMFENYGRERQLIKLLWCFSGQATTDRRADVRGHQPGPCEEDSHH